MDQVLAFDVVADRAHGADDGAVQRGVAVKEERALHRERMKAACSHEQGKSQGTWLLKDPCLPTFLHNPCLQAAPGSARAPAGPSPSGPRRRWRRLGCW